MPNANLNTFWLLLVLVLLGGGACAAPDVDAACNNFCLKFNECFGEDMATCVANCLDIAAEPSCAAGGLADYAECYGGESCDVVQREDVLNARCREEIAKAERECPDAL